MDSGGQSVQSTLAITSPNVVRFSQFISPVDSAVIVRVAKWPLKITPHLKRVATLNTL